MQHVVFQKLEKLDDFEAVFPDEESCFRYLENLRWKGDIISPFNRYSRVYACSRNRYRCRTTGKYFNVCTNTIFHGTKLDLKLWFRAIWYVWNDATISISELSVKLNVTNKTAWLMRKKLSNSIENLKSENKQLALTDWLSKLS